MRRALLAVAVTAGLVAPTGTATASASALPRFASAHGLKVVSVRRLSARDYNIRVRSADIGRPFNVRVLLPVGYAAHPHTGYPVLYLFHGTSGWASDWPDKGDAAKTTAPYPVITVMPDCGFDGDGGFWFTNWVDRTTSHGPSQFESYLIDQLIPWVDANLRTVAARRGRAVAGLSQGGYGAAEMAARHPDLFTVMGSFSGAPEIDRDPEVVAGATVVVEGTASGLDRVEPEAMFGSRVTDEINWQGHDPSTLMSNLRGMGIYLWTGAGKPGPYDSTPPDGGAMGIEALVHQSTLRFHQHLVQAGIPHYYDDYTDGTHSWGYWARDLRAFMKPMMRWFAHSTTPRVVSYLSIDPHWRAWGWSVSWRRPAALQFSRLEEASPRGFTLTGAGVATVVTPPFYRPFQSLRVSVSTPSGGTVAVLRADRVGRLALQVPLPAATGIPGASGTATATVTIVLHR